MSSRCHPPGAAAAMRSSTAETNHVAKPSFETPVTPAGPGTRPSASRSRATRVSALEVRLGEGQEEIREAVVGRLARVREAQGDDRDPDELVAAREPERRPVLLFLPVHDECDRVPPGEVGDLLVDLVRVAGIVGRPDDRVRGRTGLEVHRDVDARALAELPLDDPEPRVEALKGRAAKGASQDERSAAALARELAPPEVLEAERADRLQVDELPRARERARGGEDRRGRERPGRGGPPHRAGAAPKARKRKENRARHDDTDSPTYAARELRPSLPRETLPRPSAPATTTSS